ncbi:hypothetical protein BDP55DRAFT_725121 [Colletotrichum godetiae]|uniref:Uncharacterized protein n=1 Tax=Colletotrichum godetiae TaxID=1209918 RepID=A0AAJ0ASR6_9PEZI|nr:uncharacterized protein BDP55DRAFT_725121 [Colletotrichum godetiae]KAK1689685.1 hypothetical protein BDP55DRAFT_725121 [Colletotrichum godetiae]
MPDGDPSQQPLVRRVADRPQVDALRTSEIQKAQLACLLQDKGSCVITKSADPKTCLVLQFPDKEDLATMEDEDVQEHLKAMFGLDMIHSITTAQLQAASLSLTNVISLNDTLSKWWAKSWIALEPVAKTDLSIRLRLRWLREPLLDEKSCNSAGKAREDEIYLRTVFLNADPRLNSKKRRAQSGKPLRMVHFETREYIEDGYECDITADKKEDLPDFGLLEFRYKLSLLISLSGEGLDKRE